MMILIHILRLSVAAARPVLPVLGPLVIFFLYLCIYSVESLRLCVCVVGLQPVFIFFAAVLSLLLFFVSLLSFCISCAYHLELFFIFLWLFFVYLRSLCISV